MADNLSYAVKKFEEEQAMVQARRLVGRRGGSGKQYGGTDEGAGVGAGGGAAPSRPARGMGERCKLRPPSGSVAEPQPLCNF